MTPLDFGPFERFWEARDAQLGGLDPGRDPARFLQDLEAAAGDTAALRRYAEACPVAGASPADYAPRLLALTPTCSVIARIHFRGLDSSFPFVDVSAQTASLPDALDTLFEEFALFRPKALRIWQSPSEPLPKHGRHDLAVFAGHIPSLLTLPPPANSSRIALEPDPSLESFDDYLSTYQALQLLEPELADMHQPEDRGTLRVCADAGAYFRVVIEGKHAGFVAARLDSFRLWSGWCVIEEVLEPEFRGHGLAPACQFALLSRLDLERAPHVFGTIDARNTPSSKTALRVGRRKVEVATFLPAV